MLIQIPPHWKIVPEQWATDSLREDPRAILMSRGEGWGDGAHPTTQLCLQALTLMWQNRSPFSLLDFGSGSGILSIAAAKLGATVQAVEIDEIGTRHAAANAELNQVAFQIHPSREIKSAPHGCDVVVANILRPVLLAFAPRLVQVLKPHGTLILSGLVSTDLPEIMVKFSDLIEREHEVRIKPESYRKLEWNAVVWNLNAN